MSAMTETEQIESENMEIEQEMNTNNFNTRELDMQSIELQNNLDGGGIKTRAMATIPERTSDVYRDTADGSNEGDIEEEDQKKPVTIVEDMDEALEDMGGYGRHQIKI